MALLCLEMNQPPYQYGMNRAKCIKQDEIFLLMSPIYYTLALSLACQHMLQLYALKSASEHPRFKLQC